MHENISALRDIREIAALPLAAAFGALAVTWVVWYLTGNSCTDELADLTGCNASVLATLIHPALLKDILTNSAIAATGGGVWSYVMITRERRAREAAERALAEERRQKEEALARVEEERRRADEDRARFLAEIERLTRQLDEGNNGARQ